MKPARFSFSGANRTLILVGTFFFITTLNTLVLYLYIQTSHHEFQGSFQRKQLEQLVQSQQRNNNTSQQSPRIIDNTQQQYPSKSPVSVLDEPKSEETALEFSTKSLNMMKKLLAELSPGEDWIWSPSGRYRSTPYQPTIIDKEPKPPKAVENVMLPPQSVKDEVQRVCSAISKSTNPNVNKDKLCQLFTNCYPNTLSTTTTLLDDDTTFIITGDIDLMWLRDSSAQVHHYLPLHKDPEIQRIIEGLIVRQSIFITKDPYGSSFRLTLRPNPPSDDDLGDFHVGKARNMYVAMHNYELDSLCYHIALSYEWWQISGRTNIFTAQWLKVIELIIHLWIVEQNHSQVSPYRYVELPNSVGNHVSYTGMTWTGFRPSDDQTQFGYLVPANMFASVALGYIDEIATQVYHDEAVASLARNLKRDIDKGIHDHAIRQHQTLGKVYAYEVDGQGGAKLMDDANVPSLLSIPYLKYQSPYPEDEEVAKNTRAFVLSTDNPFFYSGRHAKGVGSPHTPHGYVWHMAVIMQGLTTTNTDEIDEVLTMLQATDAGTNFMHEGFQPDNPAAFTRHWFAWANSLFAEFVLKNLNYISK